MMPKVYVCVIGDPEYQAIVSVLDSKEKAEQWQTRTNKLLKELQRLRDKWMKAERNEKKQSLELFEAVSAFAENNNLLTIHTRWCRYDEWQVR